MSWAFKRAICSIPGVANCSLKICPHTKANCLAKCHASAVALRADKELYSGFTLTVLFLFNRLRFHDDNEYENDNEISLSFSIRFLYTKRGTTRRFHFVVYYNGNEYRNPGSTQEMMMSAHKHFVLVLVVVVVVES